MTDRHNTDRRKFMRNVALIATTAAATGATRAFAATEMLDEADPIAVSLGYKADATQVDVEKYPKRAGPEGAKQLCSNCSLYTDKGNGVGLCAAIPGKLVAGPGWCQVWAPAG